MVGRREKKSVAIPKLVRYQLRHTIIVVRIEITAFKFCETDLLISKCIIKQFVFFVNTKK